MSSEVLLVKEKPTAEEYIEIRKSAGWGVPDLEQAQKSIQHAQLTICLRKEGELVGLGRIVGDGILYFFIAEIVLKKKAQGLGYGKLLMDSLMDHITKNATSLSTIGVFAAPGRETFYEKYGFSPCPNEVFGKGMTYLKLIDQEIQN